MTHKIGTIIAGTHQLDDILPPLAEVWKAYHPDGNITSSHWASSSTLTKSIIVGNLMDDIDEALPFGLYCGWHPGDAADLGIWPDYDAIDAARADGDLTVLVPDATIFDIIKVTTPYAVIYSTDGLGMAMLSVNDDGARLLWSTL